MAEVKTTELTCIIVVQTRDSEVGIIVDGVSEVVDVTSENLVETPSFGAQVTTEYIIGIYKEEDGVAILLDIDKVISELQEVPEDEKTRRIQCLDS